jgi:anti-sigma regulatory factor (Ser/Thr protein kinase)
MLPLGEQARGRRERASVRLALERGPEAPAVARAAAGGLCEQIGLTGSRCQTLLLLVSEIVTNAVLHSGAAESTPILFEVVARGRRVRVEVHDGGRGFKPAGTAQPGGGWGLRLLQKETARWGIDTAQGTKVWFELSV